jgi:putative cell wall-binding protein
MTTLLVMAAAPSSATAIEDGFVTFDEIRRLYGDDRYETAAALARDGWTTGSDTIVLTSGENWPDALAAGPAAGAYGYPILLTRRDSLPLATADALRELGARSLILIGGPAVIGEGLEQTLRAEYPSVRRVWGQDRYETAAAVARAFPRTWLIPGFAMEPGQVSVVRGDRYDNALQASLSYGGRLLLVRPNSPLTPGAVDYLRNETPLNVFWVGAPSALATAKSGFEALGLPVLSRSFSEPDPFVRSGSNIVEESPALPVVIVSGENWPDAIAAAPYAARLESYGLLTRQACIPAFVWRTLDIVDPPSITFIGGQNAISQDAFDGWSCVD